MQAACWQQAEALTFAELHQWGSVVVGIQVLDR